MRFGSGLQAHQSGCERHRSFQPYWLTPALVVRVSPNWHLAPPRVLAVRQ